MSNKKNEKVAIRVVTGIMLFSALPVILILILFISSAINSSFINSQMVRHTVSVCFNHGNVNNLPNRYLEYDNGFVIIGAHANDYKEGLDNLKNTYYKLSKKNPTKKINKINITVYTPSEDAVLFTSNLDVTYIKNTDWSSIKTYEEFIEIAKISK